jgi:hypothetical protein
MNEFSKYREKYLEKNAVVIQAMNSYLKQKKVQPQEILKEAAPRELKILAMLKARADRARTSQRDFARMLRKLSGVK